jgi:hypothetical protein
MSDPLAQRLSVDPGQPAGGRVAVANVVQPDAGQPGSVSQLVEADGDRVRVRRPAVLVDYLAVDDDAG